VELTTPPDSPYIHHMMGGCSSLLGLGTNLPHPSSWIYSTGTKSVIPTCSEVTCYIKLANSDTRCIWMTWRCSSLAWWRTTYVLLVLWARDVLKSRT